MPFAKSAMDFGGAYWFLHKDELISSHSAIGTIDSLLSIDKNRFKFRFLRHNSRTVDGRAYNIRYEVF